MQLWMPGSSFMSDVFEQALVSSGRRYRGSALLGSCLSADRGWHEAGIEDLLLTWSQECAYPSICIKEDRTSLLFECVVRSLDFAPRLVHDGTDLV